MAWLLWQVANRHDGCLFMFELHAPILTWCCASCCAALPQVAERAGVHNTDVKNVIIWGNHSSTQVGSFKCIVGVDTGRGLGSLLLRPLSGTSTHSVLWLAVYRYCCECVGTRDTLAAHPRPRCLQMQGMGQPLLQGRHKEYAHKVSSGWRM